MALERLSLASRGQRKIELVLEGFEPSRPYVFFKGYDDSITAINIVGVRKNMALDILSKDVLKACYGQAPDGFGCDMHVFSEKPMELKSRLWKGITLYQHRTVNGLVVWVPKIPSNILAVQEEKNKEAAA